MIYMDNVLKARELTKSFNSNQWSRMTMQRKDPSIVSSYTPKFKEVIAAIELAYPNSTWEEACFLIKTNKDAPSTCEYCNGYVPFRPGNTKAPYKKFCCNECKVSAQANPAAEAVIIDGVFYRDFLSAISATGESRLSIRNKIFDSTKPNYSWSENHEDKCVDKLNNVSALLVDINVLQEWHKTGKTLSELQSITGIDRSMISCAFNFYGLDHRYEQIPESALIYKNNVNNILAELYENLNTEEIAKLIGVSPKSVQNWLKQHNIQMDYSKSQSKIERTIFEWIQSYSPETKVVQRDRSIGPEIDLYFPEKKFGVEFDGLYFHSHSPLEKSKKFIHSSKRDLCYKNNITLLRFVDVGETSDIDKLDIVKSMISSRIGKNKKIFARNCVLKPVDKQTATKFFKENHLSGSRGASHYYGLYSDGEIIQCMSFGKPLMDKSYDWEIVRLASKKYTTVVGGASKIFKHFTKLHPGSVMSYVDLRHGDGSVYKKIGMEFVGKTLPGYFYTDMKNQYSRYKFRKPDIEKMCPVYDSNLSEFENAAKNNFRIYWNCGNLKFAWQK